MKIKVYFFLFMAMLSQSLHAAEINKNAWINAITTALPAAFCKASQYHRQCFSVTAQECEEVTATAASICLNKNNKKIPNTLTLPRDDTLWGAIINVCASRVYETSLIQKRVNNNKCNDPGNWQ